jgi:hypothetical protein
VDKVALGQVFSEYFGFPCQLSFHRLLHNHHLSSGAGTIGQIVADVPSGVSLTPRQDTKIKLRRRGGEKLSGGGGPLGKPAFILFCRFLLSFTYFFFLYFSLILSSRQFLSFSWDGARLSSFSTPIANWTIKEH